MFDISGGTASTSEPEPNCCHAMLTPPASAKQTAGTSTATVSQHLHRQCAGVAGPNLSKRQDDRLPTDCTDCPRHWPGLSPLSKRWALVRAKCPLRRLRRIRVPRPNNPGARVRYRRVVRQCRNLGQHVL